MDTVLAQILSKGETTSLQVTYQELRQAVQEAYDREITNEYEKRERMVQRVVELEREIVNIMA